MPPKPPILTMSTATFLQRIAWLEFHGHIIEANALRELASWFTPPYRVDEVAVRAHMAVLQEAAKKPPRLD